jgi:hypothetical protein
MRANFSDSAVSIAPYCSDVEAATSSPCAATFSRNSGIARILPTSALSRSITGFGVPAGASSPNQRPMSNPGRPACANVGTFGSGNGVSPEIASTLSLPAFTFPSTVAGVWNESCAWPAITSCTAGAEPL